MGREKNKILGIRIDEETFENFENFCDSRNLSKSEVARKAIMQYVHIIYDPDQNAKLIFSKSQLKFCLDCMTPAQIKGLVQLSVENGSKDMAMLQEIVSPSHIGSDAQNALDFQFKTLLRFVFSPEGQNWFDQAEYTWKADQVIFQGVHRLGSAFSDYIGQLLEAYADRVGYQLDTQVFQRRRHAGGPEASEMELSFIPKL